MKNKTAIHIDLVHKVLSAFSVLCLREEMLEKLVSLLHADKNVYIIKFL